MLDGDFVQILEALGLWHTIIDHNGIDVLHVRDADELVDGGIVALVALISKPLEFGGFKIRVVQRLPKTKILTRLSVAHRHLDSSLLNKVFFFSSSILRLLSRNREHRSQKRCDYYTKICSSMHQEAIVSTHR